jgi:hypothetical protein
LRIIEITPIQLKAAAFLVRKQGFDVSAFLVPPTGFIPINQIGHQIQGLVIARTPPANHLYGTIRGGGEAHLPPHLLVAALNGDVFQRAPGPRNLHLNILGRAADEHLITRHHRLLQFHAVKIAIAQNVTRVSGGTSSITCRNSRPCVSA